MTAIFKNCVFNEVSKIKVNTLEELMQILKSGMTENGYQLKELIEGK